MTEPDDYDNPWKEALEDGFPEFMAFFFPTIATEIDWKRGYDFLDQELRQPRRLGMYSCPTSPYPEKVVGIVFR